jgi:hypothetical protein
MISLLDIRAHDGSRQFASQPQTRVWYDVRDHVSSLVGAILTSFVCDNVTEAWIDFTYGGHSFTINDQFGEYWFFVNDPKCPDEPLTAVASRFARILKPSPLTLDRKSTMSLFGWS